MVLESRRGRRRQLRAASASERLQRTRKRGPRLSYPQKPCGLAKLPSWVLSTTLVVLESPTRPSPAVTGRVDFLGVPTT